MTAACNIRAALRSAVVTGNFFGQVGNRCYVPTAIGDNLQYQFTSKHLIWAPSGGITDLYVAEPNFWVDNSTFSDTGTGGTLTATMGIEYPTSTFTQALYGGSGTGSIASGTIGWAKATVNLPPGVSTINVLRYIRNANVIALTRQNHGARRNLSYGDIAMQGGTDKTLTGGMTDSGGDYMCWPGAIVAVTNNSQVSIGGIGNSRTAGEGDTTPTTPHMGQLFDSLGQLFPYQNQGVSGQPFVTTAKSVLRRSLLQYCTTIISANGINARTDPPSTMYAASQQQGLDMFPREYWQSTLFPVTSSTNGWIDLAGQTVDGFNSNRVGFNSLVLGSTPHLDIAAMLEVLSKWIGQNPPLTDDGLHGNSLGYDQIQLAGLFTPAITDFSSFMPSVHP